MNRILITLVCWIIIFDSVNQLYAEQEERLRNEASQVELWEKTLIDSREKSDNEKLSALGLGLRNMGYRKSFAGHSPDVDVIYHKLQSELLSIPGHAEFFNKPVIEAYAAYRDPGHPKHGGSLTWFEKELRYGWQTLKHLPSPETVKVLGEMLREEWEKEPNPNSDVDPTQSLAKYSVTAMTLLSIRDAPSAAIEQYSAPDVLADWQAWYEQIKSGQRTFSFKGQAVEYRFNPDGAWETIQIANPVDDAVQVPSKEDEARADKQSPPSPAYTQVNELTERSFTWWWLLLPALIAAGISMIILIRRVTTLRTEHHEK